MKQAVLMSCGRAEASSLGWDVARQVKGLPGKHEDLSSYLQNPRKAGHSSERL